MVVGASYRDDAVLVGRDRETAQLLAAIGARSDAAAATVIVHGEAGIGKTSLVAASVAALGTSPSDAVVCRGACLPLIALTVPFIGIRSALHRSPRAVSGSGALPPGPDMDAAPARVPVLLDRWVDEVTRSRRLVIVIDDLQWADHDTLDALLYLVAGPAERPLTLIGTVRDETAQERVIDQWLADLRRMPRVEIVGLGPLDRAGTDALVSALLGRPPDESLVDEVFAKTRGHPYLTELTLSGVPPDAAHLPPDLPDSVTSAVLGAVRMLSPPAQAVLGPLAVAGRPLSLRELSQVMADGDLGLPPELALRTVINDALRAGVLAEETAGMWFRHPLSAELVESGLEPADRHHWHAVLAEFETSLDGPPGPGLDRLLRVADHHHRSGDVERAYWSALDAAELAREAGAGSQELRLLLRALELDPRVEPRGLSRFELLRRARGVAESTGALDEELSIVEEVLNTADLADLVRAEFLLRRIDLRAITQREIRAVPACEAVLALTRRHPTTWQHAQALTRWADAHLDLLSPPPGEVVSASAAAVMLARKTGHAPTLAIALANQGWVHLARSDRAAAAATFAEASDIALVAHEWVAFNEAAHGINATVDTWLSARIARLLQTRRLEMAAAGAPHKYIAWLAAAEAAAWLYIGEWEECATILRFIVGRDPGRYSGTAARLTAARLAMLQGRQSEAEAHIVRIREISESYKRFALLGVDVIRSEVLLAAGDPEAAYAAAKKCLSQGEPPDFGEWLLPLAARALADEAEGRRERREDDADVLAELDRLLTEHPRIQMGTPPVAPLARARETALTALYASEVRRARRAADEAGSWSVTVEAMNAAGLPWEEAYSCRRLAEALLRGAGGARRVGAARVAIRRGLALTDRLRATPVAEALHRLADSAHITLDGAGPPADPVDLDRLTSDPRLSALTDREREVLAHIAAGDTYAETATALFISEKTVSAHVSHLLTKTGTTNRVELAQLVAAPVPERGIR